MNETKTFDFNHKDSSDFFNNYLIILIYKVIYVYAPLMNYYSFFCFIDAEENCRSPPSMNLFEKRKDMEEKIMLNDFQNRDFLVKKDSDNSKTYFIKMKGRWIEISREVYLIYKGSYQKMYRDFNKEKDKVVYSEYIDQLSSKESLNPIDQIWFSDMKELLHNALEELSKEDQMLIYNLFYEEISERRLGVLLGVSKTTIHYRKKKILKKLRDFIYQYE